MLENELISFVVIAYNEAESIARALASIGALKDLDGYEVIVVDDGSRDKPQKLSRKLPPRILACGSFGFRRTMAEVTPAPGA